MGSIWLLSGGDKPPPKPRKSPAKRPPRRGTGAKGRLAAGKRRSEEPKPAEKPKPKAQPRRATNSYHMEITTLAEATAALPPDFRDAVIRVVNSAVALFKRAWRALHGSGMHTGGTPETPAGSSADAPAKQQE